MRRAPNAFACALNSRTLTLLVSMAASSGSAARASFDLKSATLPLISVVLRSADMAALVVANLDAHFAGREPPGLVR